MSKVIVTFSDTVKNDALGNPVVDIDTEATPQFPEDEKNFSPAHKAALQFLARGGQPNVSSFLDELENQLEAGLSYIHNTDKEAPLPFDLELLKCSLISIRNLIAANKGSFN